MGSLVLEEVGVRWMFLRHFTHPALRAPLLGWDYRPQRSDSQNQEPHSL
ncbi:MAG: hypothetical protein HC768_20635 [Acaryochloris sp. CRU_2_0]|nr:hypothetical protein [Acaryochloris sp. CRU_2_0]